MSEGSPKREARGPFRVDQLHPGDRYELSEGHPVYCAPTGGDGARGNGVGFEVLDTDPDVDSAGIDAGYSAEPGMLRAPDIAVGGVPDKPGWIAGAPPLAVEYAGSGQDERELQDKVQDLLRAGTRFIWVVRLIGPRRVEVYEPNRPVRTLGPGEELLAPGVLRNAVPVEALYDRQKAHQLTLRNLLQRRGYERLEDVHAEGRLEGQAEGLLKGQAKALLAVLAARGIPIDEPSRALILACRDDSVIASWLKRAVEVSTVEALFV